MIILWFYVIRGWIYMILLGKRLLVWLGCLLEIGKWWWWCEKEEYDLVIMWLMVGEEEGDGLIEEEVVVLVVVYKGKEFLF